MPLLCRNFGTPKIIGTPTIYIGPWPWIESILFGFVILGATSALYEIVLSRRLREATGAPPHPFVFLSLVSLGGFGMIVFVPFMNSIYAAILAFFLCWAVTMFLRKDLLMPSFFSAIFITGIALVLYQIILFFLPGLVFAWWELEHISGILILGVPLEEYQWFFFMGLACGPMYELLKGIKFVPRSLL